MGGGGGKGEVRKMCVGALFNFLLVCSLLCVL